MPLFGEGAFGLALLVLWVFCIVDVIRTPDIDVRNLPKLLWLFIVLLIPDIGSILWLILGRPQAVARREPRHGHMSAYPEYDRPGRFAAANPDDDAEFLRAIRDRAEEQRKRAADQRRIAEQRAAEERERHRGGGDPTA
jgi:hypothetical protein